ncbi:hypothetical protein GPECTOR_60g768 [Gonium pectorale]|uniref:Uncharacterized protein n=1 Tax=Gonium pectorale TaxID=33097 RepID=A0A150G538_GONPE|nr:hypothetical protein GPECTOR_60g768 [Gonium pectorale]|eukprot:KXZ44989.1 hypothetical protein GPECTOR_60g768 [Gonium pectorale]
MFSTYAFVVVPASASCVDSFTGLALPFAIAGMLYRPSSGAASATATPVTRLLQYASTSADDAVLSSYAMVGVDASSAQTGAVEALRSSTQATRLTGLRMLAADTRLSSLIVIASASLAAFPAGTIPACATAETRATAVYKALARQASAAALDLTSSSLLAAVLTDAAATDCKAAEATTSRSEVTALVAQAAQLYQTAAASLSLSNSSVQAELLALPLAALSLASRVSYVVQTAGAPSLASLAGNPQAVAQLTGGWTAQLNAAPVRLAAMGYALGFTAIPADLRLTVRSTGALAACKVAVENPYQMTATTATTDDKGAVNLTSAMGPLVTVPAGCRDTVLSTANSTVVTAIPLPVLLPIGTDNATIDSVSALVTAVFKASAAAATWAPRHISSADYSTVYNYFGVGRSSAADALPAGADFVRQNWNATLPIATRAYLLNLRVAAVVGPTSKFVAGYLKAGYTPDVVARVLLSTMAQDLLSAGLKLGDQDYMTKVMVNYITAQQATRRSLATTLSISQLTAVISAVASTVSQSTAILTQLDQQVASAAAAGSPVDAAVVLRSAAQVASVQQTSMSAALAELADAAAAGDATALEALTTAFTANFTGSALQAHVQSASVDSGALIDQLSDGTTTDPGVDGGAATASAVSKGVNVPVVVGCTVGIIGGAAVIGAAVLMTIKARRASSHISPRSSGHHDSAAPASAGAGGAAVAPADVESGQGAEAAPARPAAAGAAAPE